MNAKTKIYRICLPILPLVMSMVCVDGFAASGTITRSVDFTRRYDRNVIDRKVTFSVDPSNGLFVYRPDSSTRKTVLHESFWWSILTASAEHPHVIDKKYLRFSLEGQDEETLRRYRNPIRYEFTLRSLEEQERDKSIYSKTTGSKGYLDYSDYSTEILIMLHRQSKKSYVAPEPHIAEQLRLQIETTMQAMFENQNLSLISHLSSQGFDQMMAGWLLINHEAETFTINSTKTTCLLKNGTILSLAEGPQPKGQVLVRVESLPQDAQSAGNSVCPLGIELMIPLAKAQERQNEFLLLVDDVLAYMGNLFEIGDKR